MDIKRTPVKSSSIASVGYEPKHAILAVQFKNGGLYHFNNVSPAAHQALIGAKSIGQYFGKNFRGGTKIGK